VAGLAGLLLSDAAIWSAMPMKYCYRTADLLACSKDLATCEAEQKLAGAPLTSSCRWEDDPFGKSAPKPARAP
jgi:hypothetical protein